MVLTIASCEKLITDPRVRELKATVTVYFHLINDMSLIKSQLSTYSRCNAIIWARPGSGCAAGRTSVSS